MSYIQITGSAPGLPLSFIAAGEMASSFSEGYSVSIDAKDKTAEGSGRPGQSPHPPNVNFDKGQFDNTRWTVQLFSGVLVNGKEVYSGRDIVNVAQTLFRLSLPRTSGKTFVGPPLVTVSYANFWRATGLFQKVGLVSQGAFDKEGYPTLMTVEMEFLRHFGGGSQQGSGGVYKKAEFEDLQKATASSFAFNG